MQNKTPLRSKQIWTGFAVTAMGVMAVMAEAWSMLNVAQQELLGRFFGPELITMVGIVMVVLRAVTTSGLVWKQPEE